MLNEESLGLSYHRLHIIILLCFMSGPHEYTPIHPSSQPVFVYLLTYRGPRKPANNQPVCKVFIADKKHFVRFLLEKVTFQFKVVKKFKDEIVNFMGSYQATPANPLVIGTEGRHRKEVPIFSRGACSSCQCCGSFF